MCRRIIIAAFFVVASSDNYGLVHFSKNSAMMLKCIDNYFNTNRLFQVNSIGKSFLKETTEEFSRVTVTENYITTAISDAIERHFTMGSNHILRTQLKTAIKEALMDCADKDDGRGIESIRRSGSASEDRLDRQLLPHFVDELTDDGLLVDLILVNWHCSSQNRISTVSRRSVLRRYVQDVLDVLERAYFTGGRFNLDDDLRASWMRRAELFFNVDIRQAPYIDHIYSVNFTAAHTHGDNSIFLRTRDGNYNNRNPEIQERFQYGNILFIHANDIFNGLDDIFDYYQFRMNYGDAYFEDHVNQCFRIVFFFLELQERGILTDEDDDIVGDNLESVVPREILEIVYDDSAYRDYLLRRRTEELARTDNYNIYRQNLARSPRPREIDLIMLHWTRLRNQDKNPIILTNNSTISSTEKTVTTTPKNDKTSEGNGSGTTNEHGNESSKDHTDTCCQDKCCIDIYKPSTSGQTRKCSYDYYNFKLIRNISNYHKYLADVTVFFTRILRSELESHMIPFMGIRVGNSLR